MRTPVVATCLLLFWLSGLQMAMAQSIASEEHAWLFTTLPEAHAVEPALPARLTASNRDLWPRGLVSLGTSPVDLSFLNAPERPAGKRGFLKAEDGQLVFEDGTVARFWGTNLTAHALFRTSLHTMRLQARRLSRLGFNLVRIHHHDSRWVNPNVFGSRAPDTLTLNEEALRSLDWWVKSLGDEGIYVWLDLHVGREFTVGDRVDDFEEMAKGKPTSHAKGFAYLNPSVEQRMRDFNRAILTRTNPNTGLAYKDDPRIAFVLITNENDLTHHFGNAFLPDKNVPRHNAVFTAEAARFAIALMRAPRGARGSMARRSSSSTTSSTASMSA